MKIAPIETNRLSLRGFAPEDALFAIGIWNNPETGEYLTDEPMETIDPAYLKLVEGLGDDPACCYLIAESRETGERIGTCSFLPGGDGAVYDIAYCVAKEYWRQGYATEIAMGLRDFAKSRGARKLTIHIFQGNTASIRVAEKLGCRIASQRPYQKADKVLTEYRYELDL